MKLCPRDQGATLFFRTFLFLAMVLFVGGVCFFVFCFILASRPATSGWILPGIRIPTVLENETAWILGASFFAVMTGGFLTWYILKLFNRMKEQEKDDSKMKKLAFLVSGSGTNMENLIKRIRAGEIAADPVIVISNKPGVKALDRAREYGVPTAVIAHKDYATRELFDEALARTLDAHKVDYIVLAGFMRVLTEGFVKKYYGRLINIHPALLPAFPGAHGIRDAWDAKVKETGVTVHFVDSGVDTGPIILQRKVSVLPTDTLETLETRIHQLEYEIYPEALKLVLLGNSQIPS